MNPNNIRQLQSNLINAQAAYVTAKQLYQVQKDIKKMKQDVNSVNDLNSTQEKQIEDNDKLIKASIPSESSPKLNSDNIGSEQNPKINNFKTKIESGFKKIEETADKANKKMQNALEDPRTKMAKDHIVEQSIRTGLIINKFRMVLFFVLAGVFFFLGYINNKNWITDYIDVAGKIVSIDSGKCTPNYDDKGNIKDYTCSFNVEYQRMNAIDNSRILTETIHVTRTSQNPYNIGDSFYVTYDKTYPAPAVPKIFRFKTWMFTVAGVICLLLGIFSLILVTTQNKKLLGFLTAIELGANAFGSVIKNPTNIR